LRHYSELITSGLNYEPMLELVQHISQSELRQRLFAYTSMHKLVVGFYEKIEPLGEALHIEFNLNTRKWSFKYYPRPDRELELDKIYDEQVGIEKFDRFIEKRKW